MERLKRRRDGIKRNIHILKKNVEESLKELQETLENEEAHREKILANQSLIKERETDLKKIQEEILETTEEDEEYDQEMDKATEFELEIKTLEQRIKTVLGKKQQTERSSIDRPRTYEKQTVRLPKLEIKRFGGEPTEWQQFFETFQTAIHSNNNISDVEKFTYLKGYLTNEAAAAINGFSLTANNYEQALELLKERFGNEKLIVSTHMNNLLKIKPVTKDRDVKGLRTLYDNIETQARSLESLGIDSANYGALLAPVIMEKIPHFIRLIINRSVKEWDLKLMLKVLREELQARENCGNTDERYGERPIKHEEQMDHRKNFTFYSRENSQPNTASSLLVGTPSCVFCRGQHFSDRCNVISDVEARKGFLRKAGKCFLCLRSGHVVRDCERKKGCYYCKKSSHHSAICDSQGDFHRQTATNVCGLSPVGDIGYSLSDKETPRVSNKKVPEESPVSTMEERVAAVIAKKEAKTMLFISTRAETYSKRDLPLHAEKEANTLLSNSSRSEARDFPIHVNKPTYLLQTAEAFIPLKNGSKIKVRLLLDSGSQRTYVSKALVTKLGLKPTTTEEIHLSTFGRQSTQAHESDVFEFALSSTSSNEQIKLKAIAMNHICNPITGQEIIWAIEHHEHLHNLKLADSGSGALDIDILVGNDHYWDIITGETIRSRTGPTAVNSKLGWVLSGPTSKPEQATNTNLVHTMEVNLHQQTDSLEAQVKGFWDLETLGIRENETNVIDEVVERITLNEQGLYEVSLPFKEAIPMIPDNYKTSEQRLMSLYRKLKKNPEQLAAYDKIMKEQASQGIIETAEGLALPGQVHYLPHHGVIREDKDTTKLRIVYDASSSQSNSPSLNDCLYKGPQLNPLLYEVLILFRTFPIALTSDIEKAFLQISVNPAERDFLRFLWFDDVFSDNPTIVRNRFARLIFGVNSSPFLLTGTMRKHISTYNDIDPEFVRKVTESFHVDDFTSGESTFETAYELYKKLKLRFKDANFNLRKWRTNHPKLRKLIESLENETTTETETEAKNEREATKHLGILWDDENDELLFQLGDNVRDTLTESPTKRNVLKVIASFYDPLGIVQPIIVSLKVLFQEICKSKCDWDDVIPDDLRYKWTETIKELQQIDTIRVKRPYTVTDQTDPVIKYELHGFSDASQQAYGACVYLKTVTKSTKVNVSLITSKTRVAPLKPTTIPRLELLGNTILAELTTNVATILKKEIPIDRTVYWTDSQITLAWIKSFKKEYKTFVENRLRKIRELTNANDWRFVATNCNPADMITRYISTPKIINDSLWFNGPEFLSKNDAEWPAPPETQVQELLELKSTTVNTVSNVPESVGRVIDINQFSSIQKLKRVTAWVLRFVKNAKLKVQGLTQEKSQILTMNELSDAELLWLKDNQHTFIATKDFETTKKQLNVFQDSTGLYRCKGRLNNAPLPYHTRSPIIIVKDHRLAELLVLYAHRQVKHMKTKQTLTELRERFWICRGRNFIRQILHRCVTCRVLDAKSYEYPSDIPPLTELRLNDHRAFYATGVDNFGPLYVKSNREENSFVYKLWGTLYTCAATRGIVLDLVPDTSAPAFMRSFDRFVARRGCPDHVISDNGSNFIANDTQNYTTSKHVKWHWNLPLAPWHGGFFERMIRVVKSILKKELKTARVTYEELSTLFFQVEQIVNNRPLTYLYPSDIETCVTPNHLLFGRRLESNSHSSTSFDPFSHPVISSHQIQSILSHFWDRWRHEYLSQLRESHKSFHRSKSSSGLHAKVGDVVIIHQDFIPRHLWRLGVITKLIESKDGFVRGAEVLVGQTGSKIKRPVSKLFPIEYVREDQQANDAQQTNDDQQVNDAQHTNDDQQANDAQHTNDDQQTNDAQHTNDAQRTKDATNNIHSRLRRSKREAAIMADLKRQLVEAGV